MLLQDYHNPTITSKSCLLIDYYGVTDHIEKCGQSI